MTDAMQVLKCLEQGMSERWQIAQALGKSYSWVGARLVELVRDGRAEVDNTARPFRYAATGWKQTQAFHTPSGLLVVASIEGGILDASKEERERLFAFVDSVCELKEWCSASADQAREG